MTYSTDAAQTFIPAAGREVLRFDNGQSVVERWQDEDAGVWCYVVRDEATSESYALSAGYAAEMGLAV
jgi:hypothetical protein